MSRVLICLILLSIGINATDNSNDTNLHSENDNTKAVQTFKETARQQWELSSREKITNYEEEMEHPQETSSSETVELITWFPWFEKNGPKIHTIKAIASFKRENASSLPAKLGVGSWQEIILYGNRKEANSIEDPDASALCKNSAISTTNAFKWITTTVSLCLLVL